MKFSNGRGYSRRNSMFLTKKFITQKLKTKWLLSVHRHKINHGDTRRCKLNNPNQFSDAGCYSCTDRPLHGRSSQKPIFELNLDNPQSLQVEDSKC